MPIGHRGPPPINSLTRRLTTAMLQIRDKDPGKKGKRKAPAK
jgi:hypothetical protein